MKIKCLNPKNQIKFVNTYNNNHIFYDLITRKKYNFIFPYPNAFTLECNLIITCYNFSFYREEKSIVIVYKPKDYPITHSANLTGSSNPIDLIVKNDSTTQYYINGIQYNDIVCEIICNEIEYTDDILLNSNIEKINDSYELRTIIYLLREKLI